MAISLNIVAPVRAEPAAIAGWRDYPAGIGGQNALTAPTPRFGGRPSGLRKILFTDDVDVQIIDIVDCGGNLSCISEAYEQEAEVERVLLQPDSDLPSVRIISLHSDQSPLGIEITESLMLKILTRYKVDPAFLHVLFSFGQNPHLSESASNNLAISETDKASQNVTYQLRYADENHRSPDAPWSVRQTGVYHHHSLTRKFDLFLLIHSHRESMFERQLMNTLKTGPGSIETKMIYENPYRLHVLPFALHMDNWRWYYRRLSDESQERIDEVMTLRLETSDPMDLDFGKVQGLRDLKDEFLSLSAYCKASQGVIRALREIPESRLEGVWNLNSYDQRLEGYRESLSVLLGRISNTIDLFAYALDLKNQNTAADTNKNVYELSQKTTRDTTAVKWITYLTLVYLPGSFVASLYGMNLFVFNQTTNKLVIAQDFWIYVATWIPLTALTFFLYGIVVFFDQPAGQSRWDWIRWSCQPM